MMAFPPIVLTTDFGLADPYVGVMKGVILRINPNAALIDLTHLVQPQNVRQGAFLLGNSHRFFPQGSIHVAVVDPGVGTDRRALLLETPTARFVAPDNGLLSCVVGEYLDGAPELPGRVTAPPHVSVYHLTNPDYWLQPLSRTFHGRDVFAPVAAHISRGVPPDELGVRANDIAWLPIPRPLADGNMLSGEVVYADHFGNLVTNITGEELGDSPNVDVQVAGRTIHGLSRTFHDGPGHSSGPADLIALVGSLGYLEIAVPDGNAAAVLGVGAGEQVSAFRAATR